MKKSAIIGVAIAVATGFIACQKESLQKEQNDRQLIRETFSASFEQPTTRTTISDDGKTVTWAANDKVYYYTSDGGTVRNCTITSAGASATLGLERNPDDTCYNLVYAGNTEPTFTTKTSSSMVFNGGVGISQNGKFANANVSVGRTTPGGSAIKFKPVTALVKFTTSRTDIKTIVLTGGQGSESIAGNVSVNPMAKSPIATLDGTGSAAITVTIESPAAGTYYINVLPVNYSNGLRMTLKDAGGNDIGTVTASKGIDLSAGGKMIDFGVIDTHILSPGSAADLSSGSTANCYIVSAIGKYKFKSVKGNSAETVTPASVGVLWESFGTDETPQVGDLITGVSYADDSITFSTHEPYREGNAVIAAYDSENHILWSWHIWLTDKPADQVYNNSAGTMMDRNLGATSTTKGDVTAYGLLYQWGRKDPFLGGRNINDTARAISTYEWPSAVPASTAISGETNSLSYSILHPTTFFTNNASYSDWYCTNSSKKNDNLWKNASGSKKTIYDPCPAGYRVPDGGSKGIWSVAFNKTKSWQVTDNWDATNRGMDFGNTGIKLGSGIIWYPGSGYHRHDNNTLANVGTFGNNWSCMPDGEKVYCLGFSNDGTVYPVATYSRASGRSVRCLSE